MAAIPSNKTKDGLIKILLQSTKNSPSSTSSSSSPPPPPPSLHLLQNGTYNEETAFNYIYEISKSETFHGVITLDHNYSKHWKSEFFSFCHPAKRIFMPVIRRKLPTDRDRSGENENDDADEEQEIDVLSVSQDSVPTPRFSSTSTHGDDDDVAYNREPMNECFRFVEFANPNVRLIDENENWEEDLLKKNWTSSQFRLFKRALLVLQGDRLFSCAHQGSPHESLFRQLSLQKSTNRYRQILSSVLWRFKECFWLHESLCTTLPSSLLSSYLNILSSLRTVLPSFIDRLINKSIFEKEFESLLRLQKQGLSLLLSRPWSLHKTYYKDSKISRLPGNPFILLLPILSSFPRGVKSSRRRNRMNKWLSRLGRLISLSPLFGENSNTDVDVGSHLHSLIVSSISTIRDLKRSHPETPIVLLSWGSGSSVIAQIGAMESVSGLICLGFPMSSLSGVRGGSEDPLYELLTSILFVIGEKAHLSPLNEIEDMRERLKAENFLVIVGNGDDALRVSTQSKMTESLNQSVVDRILIDEIRSFILRVTSRPLGGKHSHFSSEACSFSGHKFGNESSNNSPLVKKPPRPRKRPSIVVPDGTLGGGPVKRPKTSLASVSSNSHKPLLMTPNTLRVSSANISAPLTKTVSSEDLIQAKKMLDMTLENERLFKAQNGIELPSSPMSLSEIQSNSQFMSPPGFKSKMILPSVVKNNVINVSRFSHNKSHNIVLNQNNHNNKALVKNGLPVSYSSLSSSVPRKENYYIVTLPSDSESSKFLQQRVVSLSDSVALSSSSSSSSSSLEKGITKDKDRRNVAEILASLSGLLPEPVISCSSGSPITITTLRASNPLTPVSLGGSGGGGGGRLVRFIQTSSGNSAIRPGRKQVFITSMTTTTPSTPISTPSPSHESSNEKDDEDYKPYAKRSKAKHN